MQGSELTMITGSFMIVPSRGPRETISGQTGLTGLTQSSATKAWKMRNRAESNLYEITSLTRTKTEYIQSNSKDLKLNFNYLKCYLCFDQVCV